LRQNDLFLKGDALERSIETGLPQANYLKIAFQTALKRKLLAERRLHHQIKYHYELKEASSFWEVTHPSSIFSTRNVKRVLLLKGYIAEFHMITTTYTDISSSVK